MSKKMSKKQFVETVLSETIHEASHNFDHLEYDEEREYVIIVCENGTRYDVNVACDSHLAIIQDVIRVALRHA